MLLHHFLWVPLIYARQHVPKEEWSSCIIFLCSVLQGAKHRVGACGRYMLLHSLGNHMWVDFPMMTPQ